MGGGSWDGGYDSPSSKVESHLSFEPKVPQEENTNKGDKNAEEIQEAVQIITGQFSLAWQSLKHVRYEFIYPHFNATHKKLRFVKDFGDILIENQNIIIIH